MEPKKPAESLPLEQPEAGVFDAYANVVDADWSLTDVTLRFMQSRAEQASAAVAEQNLVRAKPSDEPSNSMGASNKAITVDAARLQNEYTEPLDAASGYPRANEVGISRPPRSRRSRRHNAKFKEFPS